MSTYYFSELSTNFGQKFVTMITAVVYYVMYVPYLCAGHLRMPYFANAVCTLDGIRFCKN